VTTDQRAHGACVHPASYALHQPGRPANRRPGTLAGPALQDGELMSLQQDFSRSPGRIPA